MKILFLHFPKTAGTAIRNAIVRNHPTLRVLPAVDMSEISRFSAEELENYDLFAGHFDWSYFDFLGPDVCTFSMLRDPYERLLSQFFYLRTLPAIFGEAFTVENFPVIYEIVNRPPRDTFLSRDVIRRNAVRDGFDNLYTYFFFGRGYRGAQRASVAGASRERVVEIALSNMRRMSFVGSFQHLDDDLHEIERLTGLRFRHDVRRENVTESVPYGGQGGRAGRARRRRGSPSSFSRVQRAGPHSLRRSLATAPGCRLHSKRLNPAARLPRG